MPIYTKKGDDGTTGLPGKRRVKKDDPMIETLGSLDSANAALGVAISHLPKKGPVPDAFCHVQEDLLSIGAYLASPDDKKLEDSWLDSRTIELEGAIDRWDKQLPTLNNFILPGGSPAGASMQLARTFVRAAERHINRLGNPNSSVSRYINRLSDYLFQAARWINHSDLQPEKIWHFDRKST